MAKKRFNFWKKKITESTADAIYYFNNALQQGMSASIDTQDEVYPFTSEMEEDKKLTDKEFDILDKYVQKEYNRYLKYIKGNI